ncbi:hypothetical protein BRE01_08250 [Brevibacillus reuszeri]|uniref:Uncharacterized protein n=1 Tax=Brevibacillus reuszeri TaxID=54915 RepID=A0A0K9YS27_9BACL|nr:hypothetical protein [Brevibacillus reuszeri]KNB71476.1 hypothetical protein ADS79_22125 [Brevibacillus reuszeri]MED1855726.1 hypothetical protein [Brevibacillus reuszeri]GED67123.1 hypothetical protein BRE01_08250 [Brevibacillus reuszeri]
MKTPIYLYKAVESPDKIIVHYTNLGDVRNGAIAFSKTSGEGHSRLLIRDCANALEVDAKVESLLAGFWQEKRYPQSFCTDDLYLYKMSEWADEVIYAYAIRPFSVGEAEFDKTRLEARQIVPLSIDGGQEIFRRVTEHLRSMVESDQPVPELDIVEVHDEYRDIACAELTEDDLPGEMAGWGSIVTFAMTFDEFDSFEECFEASDRIEQKNEADGDLTDCSLWDLRAFLLMEERGCHHRGDWPTPACMQLIYDVMDAIREKVKVAQERKPENESP